jgi:hypothetical protein
MDTVDRKIEEDNATYEAMAPLDQSGFANF